MGHTGASPGFSRILHLTDHRMPSTPQSVAPPPGSRIAAMLPGAYFHDAWAMTASQPELTALDQFLLAARKTPRWVEACMGLRNRVVRRLGLKDLGGLSSLAAHRTARDYRPGDRVGIFTLFDNDPDEALLGDRDRHLDVMLSVHKSAPTATQPVFVTVTTVVHVHNLLGRLYMLPVTPMHKLITPVVLGAVGAPATA